MKFLFIHQNFPGQYLQLVRHLAAADNHEILFVTEDNPNFLRGARKLVYKLPRSAGPETHHDAREFEQAMIRAEAVAKALGGLKSLGFEPDLVIGHHGWGELLNIRDIWHDVPLLGYFEFFYRIDGQDVDFDPEFPTSKALHPSIRAKNAVNLLALSIDGHGQTPTRFQRTTYPDWARRKISVLPEGADLTAFRPDPAVRTEPLVINDVTIAPTDTLITYVARDLEPYRGFHVLMRALPRILAARRDARVVIVGRDGVSYGARLAEGTWRDRFLAEVRGRIDESRVHFVGRIDYALYRRMLQRSDAHVYLTYPFVASWSLREALACGCVVIGSDTAPVQEFINHEKNGLLTPFHDPAQLAEAVLRSLEDRALNQRLRAGARAFAERRLNLEDQIRRYEELIETLTGKRPE